MLLSYTLPYRLRGRQIGAGPQLHPVILVKRIGCPQRIFPFGWRLAPKFIRPVGVDRILCPSAISLKHSSSLKIHPTFLSLLKPVSESDPVPISNPPPPSLVINAAPAYTVRQILDVWQHGHGLQFLVDWDGYGPEEQAWVPRRHILDDGLWDFYQGHPDLAHVGCVPYTHHNCTITWGSAPSIDLILCVHPLFHIWSWSSQTSLRDLVFHVCNRD